MAIDDCVITVRGDGVGKYGRPVKDRTGTIRSFLVDNQVFYSAVQKHMKKCGTCSPQEVLEALLERRKANPRFAGQTSSTQVMLARRWLKAFPERVRPSIVREFAIRSGARILIDEPEYVAGAEHHVLCVAFDWARADESKADTRRLGILAELANSRFEAAAILFYRCASDGLPYPAKEDLQDLVTCSQVMTS